MNVTTVAVMKVIATEATRVTTVIETVIIVSEAVIDGPR
jgi:hypothetical protein